MIRYTDFRKHQSPGQSLVEFAFVLPVLLLLMVALIELGILFYTQMAVCNAAWEGARAGATIVNPAVGDQEIIGAVQAAAYGLDPHLLVVDIEPDQHQPPRNQPFPAPRGSPLTVMVTYRVRLTFPDVIVPVTGRAVTRMEYHNP